MSVQTYSVWKLRQVANKVGEGKCSETRKVFATHIECLQLVAGEILQDF